MHDFSCLMSAYFKWILLELSNAAYILFFCVKDEFGKHIYQSLTLVELSQSVLPGGTSISKYEELILNLECPNWRKPDACEWHPEYREDQQNTSASETFYQYLYVQKQVVFGPSPIPLLHVDNVFLIKATDPWSVTLNLKVDCYLNSVRQSFNEKLFTVFIMYVHIQLQCMI